LNVMLYGMTGVLLGAFIRRMGRIMGLPNRDMLGGIAGVIYVLFPFNYNAVIWVASMFHILAGFGAMVALWCVARVMSTDDIYVVPTSIGGVVGTQYIASTPIIKKWVWLIGAWLGVF
ncbi:MAG TPA: hypothetical protein PLZ51_22625, partial [Aggregatilineales bacterium]|nr:hypothetical protein [Aggregatilineales bacterium]